MTLTADDRIQTLLAEIPTDLFIGGRWRPATGGGRFTVEDPSDRSALAEVADAGLEDARAAMTAAADAQRGWAATAPRRRSAILRGAYDRMMDRKADLALLMTLEMGKPLAESEAEVQYAAQFFEWFSEEAVRPRGMWRESPDGSSRLMTMRQPVGPSLFVTPWNFPLAMGTRKLGPALAAGCTTIVKPAKQTPLSMLALARILEEAGVPAGVVNVVPTSRAGAVVAEIMQDERLRKLSFTGSTEVGKSLVRQSADRLLRTSMELGGNAPLVVFGDADLDLAVTGALRAKLRNNGEACTAANRIYVHESVREEFTTRLAAEFSALTSGPGADPATTIGPLIDDAAALKCEELVDDAVQRGARVVVGGRKDLSVGSYFDATILADVPLDARILKEEVFGPVAPIVGFETDEEVTSWCNDTEFGLASYVFTRDLERALRFCESVEAGMVGLNRGVLSNTAAPFGGIKQSGFGREGGDEGIEEYLDVKYVAIDRGA